MNDYSIIYKLLRTDVWAAAEEIFFTMLLENREFTKNDFWRYCRKFGLGPNCIERECERLFVQYEQSRYILKTGKTAAGDEVYWTPFVHYQPSFFINEESLERSNTPD